MLSFYFLFIYCLTIGDTSVSVLTLLLVIYFTVLPLAIHLSVCLPFFLLFILLSYNWRYICQCAYPSCYLFYCLNIGDTSVSVLTVLLVIYFIVLPMAIHPSVCLPFFLLFILLSYNWRDIHQYAYPSSCYLFYCLTMGETSVRNIMEQLI